MNSRRLFLKVLCSIWWVDCCNVSSLTAVKSTSSLHNACTSWQVWNPYVLVPRNKNKWDFEIVWYWAWEDKMTEKRVWGRTLSTRKQVFSPSNLLQPPPDTSFDGNWLNVAYCLYVLSFESQVLCFKFLMVTFFVCCIAAGLQTVWFPSWHVAKLQAAVELVCKSS